MPDRSFLTFAPARRLPRSNARRLLATIDALTEERDRLRAALREIGNQAANINHHCYQTGKLQCVSCAGSQELIEELARAALEGRE